jgi:hypothetical protein
MKKRILEKWMLFIIAFLIAASSLFAQKSNFSNGLIPNPLVLEKSFQDNTKVPEQFAIKADAGGASKGALFYTDFNNYSLSQWTKGGVGQELWKNWAVLYFYPGYNTSITFTDTTSYIMIKVPVNTEGMDKLLLTYDGTIYGKSSSNETYLRVKTTSDGGNTWHILKSWQLNNGFSESNHYNLVIDNEDVGSSTFQFGFFIEGSTDAVNYCGFDNLGLYKFFNNEVGLSSLRTFPEVVVGTERPLVVNYSNNGMDTAITDITLKIVKNLDNSVVYTKTKKDTAQPFTEKEVAMPVWKNFDTGEYSIYTSISIDNDEDISNNQVTNTVSAIEVNNRAYIYIGYSLKKQYKRGPAIIDLDSYKVIPYDLGEYKNSPYGGGDFNIDGNLYNISPFKEIYKVDTITGSIEKLTDFNMSASGVAFSVKYGCMFINNNRELLKMNLDTKEIETVGVYYRTISMRSIAINKNSELYGTDGIYFYKIDANTASVDIIGRLTYNISNYCLAFDKEKDDLIVTGKYYNTDSAKYIYIIGKINTATAEIETLKQLPAITINTLSIKSENMIVTGKLTGVIRNVTNDTIDKAVVHIFNNDGFSTNTISNTVSGYKFDYIPEGNYKMFVTAPYYNNSDTVDITISSSTPAVKDFTLTQATNKVTFVVVKYLNVEDSLKNCHILFYEADSLTGNNGTITFENIPNGNFNYKITKMGYLPAEGTVIVAGVDQTVNIKLIIDKLVARKLPLLEMAMDIAAPEAPGAENGLVQLNNSVNRYSTKLALLSYHINDDYEIAAAAERINYYGNIDIPTAIFNGNEFIQGGGDSLFSMYYGYSNYYNIATRQKTPVTINIFQKDFNDTTNQVTIGVAVQAKGVVTTPENAVHIALTQSRIKDEWNGMSEVNHVVRELYNGSAGVSVDIDSLTKKDTVYATFTLNENWNSRPKYFNVVAFVQGKNTKNGDNSKYVYNADMVKVVDPKYYAVKFVGVDEETGDTIDIKVKVNNKFKLSDIKNGVKEVVFNNVEDEDWVFNVKSFNYFDYSDTLKLRSDTTIVVKMNNTGVEYIWHEDCDRMVDNQIPEGWKFIRPINQWSLYVTTDYDNGGHKLYFGPYQFDTIVAYTPKIKIAECDSLFFSAYYYTQVAPRLIVGYTTDTSDINAIVGLDTILLGRKDSVLGIDLRNLITVDSVHFVFKYDYSEDTRGAFYVDNLAVTKISHNPHLSNIILSEGTMNPEFNRDSLNYTVILPSGSTEVPAVTPVVEYEGTSYEVTDAATIPGTTTIKVTAEDQTTELIYSLYFSLGNAFLSGITLSDGSSLTPVFDKETYSYTVVMSSSTSSVPTVSATAEDTNATVLITNANEIPGTATIKVTAEDGITVLTYYVNFTSNNTYLSGITLSDGSLSPEFNKETYTYSVVLSSSEVNIPTITALVEDPKATFEITDATSIPGTSTIIVTAVDGTTQATYTINFTSDNAYLSNITLSEGTLNPEFNKEVLTYTVDVPMGITDAPEITVTTEDANATTNITAATGVPGTSTIVVTAVDGTTQKTYTIDFVVGINYAQFSNVELYPNPTKSILNIVNTNNVKSVNILSTDGRIVLIKNNIYSDIKIKLGDLLNGTYIVKILFNDGSVLNKTIIKQ